MATKRPAPIRAWNDLVGAGFYGLPIEGRRRVISKYIKTVLPQNASWKSWTEDERNEHKLWLRKQAAEGRSEKGTEFEVGPALLTREQGASVSVPSQPVPRRRAPEPEPEPEVRRTPFRFEVTPPFAPTVGEQGIRPISRTEHMFEQGWRRRPKRTDETVSGLTEIRRPKTVAEDIGTQIGGALQTSTIGRVLGTGGVREEPEEPETYAGELARAFAGGIWEYPTFVAAGLAAPGLGVRGVLLAAERAFPRFLAANAERLAPLLAERGGQEAIKRTFVQEALRRAGVGPVRQIADPFARSAQVGGLFGGASKAAEQLSQERFDPGEIAGEAAKSAALFAPLPAFGAIPVVRVPVARQLAEAGLFAKAQEIGTGEPVTLESYGTALAPLAAGHLAGAIPSLRLPSRAPRSRVKDPTVVETTATDARTAFERALEEGKSTSEALNLAAAREGITADEARDKIYPPGVRAGAQVFVETAGGVREGEIVEATPERVQVRLPDGRMEWYRPEQVTLSYSPGVDREAARAKYVAEAETPERQGQMRAGMYMGWTDEKIAERVGVAPDVVRAVREYRKIPRPDSPEFPAWKASLEEEVRQRATQAGEEQEGGVEQHPRADQLGPSEEAGGGNRARRGAAIGKEAKEKLKALKARAAVEHKLFPKVPDAAFLRKNYPDEMAEIERARLGGSGKLDKAADAAQARTAVEEEAAKWLGYEQEIDAAQTRNKSVLGMSVDEYVEEARTLWERVGGAEKQRPMEEVPEEARRFLEESRWRWDVPFNSPDYWGAAQDREFSRLAGYTPKEIEEHQRLQELIGQYVVPPGSPGMARLREQLQPRPGAMWGTATPDEAYFKRLYALVRKHTFAQKYNQEVDAAERRRRKLGPGAENIEEEPGKPKPAQKWDEIVRDEALILSRQLRDGFSDMVGWARDMLSRYGEGIKRRLKFIRARAITLGEQLEKPVDSEVSGARPLSPDDEAEAREYINYSDRDWESVKEQLGWSDPEFRELLTPLVHRVEYLRDAWRRGSPGVPAAGSETPPVEQEMRERPTEPRKVDFETLALSLSPHTSEILRMEKVPEPVIERVRELRAEREAHRAAALRSYVEARNDLQEQAQGQGAAGARTEEDVARLANYVANMEPRQPLLDPNTPPDIQELLDETAMALGFADASAVEGFVQDMAWTPRSEALDETLTHFLTMRQFTGEPVTPAIQSIRGALARRVKHLVYEKDIMRMPLPVEEADLKWHEKMLTRSKLRNEAKRISKAYGPGPETIAALERLREAEWELAELAEDVQTARGENVEGQVGPRQRLKARRLYREEDPTVRPSEFEAQTPTDTTWHPSPGERRQMWESYHRWASRKAEDSRKWFKENYEDLKNRTNVGADPFILGHIAFVLADHLRAGYTKLTEATKRVVAELGDWVKPHVSAAWGKALELVRDEEGWSPWLEKLRRALLDKDVPSDPDEATIDARVVRSREIWKAEARAMTKRVKDAVKKMKQGDLAPLQELLDDEQFMYDWLDRYYPLQKIRDKVKATGEDVDPLDDPAFLSHLADGYRGVAWTIVGAQFPILSRLGRLAGLTIEPAQGMIRLNDPLTIVGKSLSQVAQLDYLRPEVERLESSIEALRAEQSPTPRAAQRMRALKNRLKKVAEAVDNPRRAENYLVGRRVLELELVRGIKTGWSSEELKSTTKFVTENRSIYRQLEKEVDAYNDGLLNILREAGIKDEATLLQLKELNKAYVPFTRFFTQEELPWPRRFGKSSGRRVSQADVVKRIEGSERLIVSPWESMIENAYAVVRMAMQNRAGAALARLYDRGTGKEGNKQVADIMAQYLRPVSPPHEKIQLNFEQAARALGISDVERLRAIVGPKGEEAIGLFAHRAVKENERIAWVFSGGKKRYFEFMPEGELLYKSLMQMNPYQLDLATSLIARASRVTRTAVVTPLSYVLGSGLPRDLMETYQTTRGGFNPLNFVQGTAAFLGKTELYRQALASGAGQAHYLGIGRRESKAMAPVLGTLPTLSEIPAAISGTLMGAIRLLPETAEQAVRLGEFKSVRDSLRAESKNPAEVAALAGQAGRSVTIDFARMGAMMRHLNEIFPFLNTNVQGLDKFVSTWRPESGGYYALPEGRARGKDVAGKIARRAGLSPSEVRLASQLIALVTGIIVPTTALYFNNAGDPRWKHVDPAERARNWIVFLPESVRKDPLKLRKPEWWGVVAGGLESFYDYARENDPEAWDRFKTTFMLQGTPPHSVPALELMYGWAPRWDYSRDRPMESRAVSELLSEARMTPFSSAWSQVVANHPLAQSLDLSPVWLDNAMYRTFGGFGAYTLTPVIDQMLDIFNVTKPDPRKLALPERLKPGLKGEILRAFTSKSAGAGSDQIRKLYEWVNPETDKAYGAEAATLLKDIADAAILHKGTDQYERTVARRDRLLPHAGRILGGYKVLRQAQRDMAEIRKLTALRWNDDTLTPDARQKLIERDHEHLRRIAEVYNDVLKKLEESTEPLSAEDFVRRARELGLDPAAPAPEEQPVPPVEQMLPGLAVGGALRRRRGEREKRGERRETETTLGHFLTEYERERLQPAIERYKYFDVPDDLILALAQIELDTPSLRMADVLEEQKRWEDEYRATPTDANRRRLIYAQAQTRRIQEMYTRERHEEQRDQLSELLNSQPDRPWDTWDPREYAPATAYFSHRPPVEQPPIWVHATSGSLDDLQRYVTRARARGDKVVVGSSVLRGGSAPYRQQGVVLVSRSGRPPVRAYHADAWTSQVGGGERAWSGDRPGRQWLPDLSKKGPDVVAALTYPGKVKTIYRGQLEGHQSTGLNEILVDLADPDIELVAPFEAFGLSGNQADVAGQAQPEQTGAVPIYYGEPQYAGEDRYPPLVYAEEESPSGELEKHKRSRQVNISEKERGFVYQARRVRRRSGVPEEEEEAFSDWPPRVPPSELKRVEKWVERRSRIKSEHREQQLELEEMWEGKKSIELSPKLEEYAQRLSERWNVVPAQRVDWAPGVGKVSAFEGRKVVLRANQLSRIRAIQGLTEAEREQIKKYDSRLDWSRLFETPEKQGIFVYHALRALPGRGNEWREWVDERRTPKREVLSRPSAVTRGERVPQVKGTERLPDPRNEREAVDWWEELTAAGKRDWTDPRVRDAYIDFTEKWRPEPVEGHEWFDPQAIKHRVRFLLEHPPTEQEVERSTLIKDWDEFNSEDWVPVEEDKGPNLLEEFPDPGSKHTVSSLSSVAKELMQPPPALDMKNLKKVGPQLGSQPGGVYEDSDGVRWYVKRPPTLDHVRNEILTGMLYRLAGVRVPELRFVDPVSAGALGSKMQDIGPAQTTTPGVLEGFAVDAWLANWDVVGLDYDNLVESAGSALRLDTGGGLRYRAQGKLKGDVFGLTVPELSTLRNPKMNPQAAKMFQAITPEQLRDSMKLVANIAPADIKQLVDLYGPSSAHEREALAATLLARQQDIVLRLKANQMFGVNIDEWPEGNQPADFIDEPPSYPADAHP